jgi:polysaccharide pyruvyl transferase WcaK-like protein
VWRYSDQRKLIFATVYVAKERSTLRANKRLGFFGHFGDINFGNESTLQAMLYHIRRNLPDAELTCVCSDPGFVTRLYGINAVSMNGTSAKALWLRRGRISTLIRRVAVCIPNEIYRWFEASRVLRHMDALIVPGTGLLTDVCGLRGWGPYNIFKWSVMAKICRCKLLFISVGAGPLYSRLGRWLVRSALFIADFRSYRDYDTKEYLNSIGFSTFSDVVYPDLAFSLPESALSNNNHDQRTSVDCRPVVGIGVMLYAGRLSMDRPSDEIAAEYLDNLTKFSMWLLDHGYNIRLLIGDKCDQPVTESFMKMLMKRMDTYDPERILGEKISSVESLLDAISRTDIVVATRFHNIVLALLLNKPVLAIGFHQKCVSLMNDMGLTEYCLDIKQLKAEVLIEKFLRVEKNKEALKTLIGQKRAESRVNLDRQYGRIIREVTGDVPS